MMLTSSPNKLVTEVHKNILLKKKQIADNFLGGKLVLGPVCFNL
jgi:hypothetical protein